MKYPEEHHQVLWFDTDQPEFFRGFEMGKVWAQMRDDKDEIMEHVHVRNTEMCMRLAEAGRYFFVAEYLTDDYMVVAFKKKVGRWT